MEQNRREFMKTCACMGAVGVMTWLGIGCDSDDGGTSDPGASGISANYTVDGEGRAVIDLAQNPHLNENNSSVFLANTSRGTVLVTHTTGETYFALSARCTHEGCTVGATSPTLNCPCHGSRYNLNGTVVNGPAPSPLQSFAITKVDNTLVVDLG
jgi:Rieske Fe-S protein